MKYPEDNLAKLNLFEDAHNLYSGNILTNAMPCHLQVITNFASVI